MTDGSGIVISCEKCHKTRELTAAEVTCEPTPSLAAESVLASEGWDIVEGICPDCIEESTEEIVEKSDQLDFELPVRARPVAIVPEPEYSASPVPDGPVVVFKEKDIRIVLTSADFDGGPETILVVERAHRTKDAMGQTRYAAIDIGNTVWIIQELARALFERETGQEAPAQQRVYLGGDKYIPTPNIID